jgi:SAM-dependent methyltransferase
MLDMNGKIVIDAWEQIYANGQHANRHPFSDLVSLVHRHLALLPPGAEVLELGCGYGSNIPIFSNLGFTYSGIEGARTAHDHATAHNPGANILCGDFTQPLPFVSQRFDLVVDRSALTHNKELIGAVVEEIHRVLKPGGLFIGTDFFSKNHGLWALASRPDAEKRFHLALFTDAGGLANIFARFELLYLARKSTEVVAPENRYLEFFDIVVQKAR